MRIRTIKVALRCTDRKFLWWHGGCLEAFCGSELTLWKAAELIVIGTVGRSGIKGMRLGNTAEKVLDTCACSILTVKPDGFVSPIEPAL